MAAILSRGRWVNDIALITSSLLTEDLRYFWWWEVPRPAMSAVRFSKAGHLDWLKPSIICMWFLQPPTPEGAHPFSVTGGPSYSWLHSHIGCRNQIKSFSSASYIYIYIYMHDTTYTSQWCACIKCNQIQRKLSIKNPFYLDLQLVL